MRSLRACIAIDDLERRAVARTLCLHPEWPLGDVLAYVESGGNRAEILGRLTIADLVRDSDAVPFVDLDRRRRAEKLRDVRFDQLLLEVLIEARSPVSASYLRTRLGGPRWKLQESAARLIASGRAIRTGKTSSTRYAAVGAQ